MGNKGASSGKSGAGAGTKTEQKTSVYDQGLAKSKAVSAEVNQIKEQYKSRQTKVKTLDEDGDPAVQKGYVGKNGTTFVNVKHIINDEYVLEIGTVSQGFVAEVRPGGKTMTKLEAWRMLKSYM